MGYYSPKISRDVYGDNAGPYLFYINIEHKGTIIGAKELESVVYENMEKPENIIPINEGKLIKQLLLFLKHC